MTEEFLTYDWQGHPCTEAEFIAKMRQCGMEVIHTQPLPVFNKLGGITFYMSETYRIVDGHLRKEERFKDPRICARGS